VGSYSPNADWAAHHSHAPVLSVIVAVETVDERTRQSLDDMLKVIGESPCEVIVATREIWPDPRPELTVVSCTSDSRGERFNRAAWSASGRILAILDDRVCIPDGWPQRVIECFDDPAIAIAGGPVILRTESRADRISALMLNGHLGTTRIGSASPSDRPRIGAELTESNVLIRKDVFRRVGGFRTPHAGGEMMRLRHTVRSLLGCKIHYQPDLAVVAGARRFPGSLFADTAAYGRARGDMARGFLVATARRFRGARLMAPTGAYGRATGDTAGRLGEDESPPFFAVTLPSLVAMFVFLELVLSLPFMPFRHLRLAEYVGAGLLLALYLMRVGRVAFARGPALIEDRAFAALGLPLVSVTYALAFVEGFFDTQ
jgi:hypothetical protein